MHALVDSKLDLSLVIKKISKQQAEFETALTQCVKEGRTYIMSPLFNYLLQKRQFLSTFFKNIGWSTRMTSQKRIDFSINYSYLFNKRRVANNRRVWKKYINLINEGSGTHEGPGIFVQHIKKPLKIATFFDFHPIFQ